MEYINLKTCRAQLKYIQKICEININEADYLNKINELRKLFKNWEGVVGTEDVCNGKSDMSMLEGTYSFKKINS